jgi:hypothetical protein
MRACGHAQMVKRASGSPVASAAQVPTYLAGTTEPALCTEVCSGSRAAIGGASGDIDSWSAVHSIPGMRLIHRRNHASHERA